MQKDCKQCGEKFEITEKDQEFLKKVSPVIAGKKYIIPNPSFCPDCRQQRRLSWRNERNLYHRDCDFCNKKILSIYDVDSPFLVYCNTCWWSDNWDPLDYAKDFDFNRSFFEQFKELQDLVPRMAVQQSKNENSEYTNCVSHLKNCYLLFSSDFNKDCYYGVWIENSKDCIDNLMIDRCELTHQSIFSDNIFNSSFLIHCSQCSDSAFLLDCHNCTNCFMCYGLRNKEYCIANKEYSKEDYFKQINSSPISSYKNYENFKKHFFEMIKDIPYLYIWRNGTVLNSTGDFLTDVNNCENCFELLDARDCKYVQGGYKLRDAFDCSYVHGELGYENCECFPMPNRSSFNINTYNGHDLQYCDMCMNNNEYLFGCVSLKKKKYCILNKEYSEQEYMELLPKIINHMQEMGEYGEFFPANSSVFAYNESEAFDIFPLSQDEVYKWKNLNKEEALSSDYNISDDINDVPADIVGKLLSCSSCNRNYKILQQEYNLLKKIKLPIPRDCFSCRHKIRNVFRKNRKLYKRNCSKCNSELETAYSPESSVKIYCEKCYLAEVY